MLLVIPMIWVLSYLGAPSWCFWCVYITVFIKFCEFIGAVYKAGKESES